MKNIFALIFILAVFVLINGPPIYSTDLSTDDVTVTSFDMDMENHYDFTIQEDIQLYAGSLELIELYGTQDVNEIICEIFQGNLSQMWLTNDCLVNDKSEYMSITNMDRSIKSSSPDRKLLAQTNVFVGLSRLDIGETFVIRHNRQTYS